MKNSRREFLWTGAAVAASLAIPLTTRADEEGEGKEEGISAPEDLMREHGVLERILLVYEEGIRRLRAGEDVPPEVFRGPAGLVRSFVEDYHERLEETHIFPLFEKHDALGGLAGVLALQHAAGRRLTDTVLQNALGGSFVEDDARARVIVACESFSRMYRPHAAREDTVLFPALYEVLEGEAIRDLGERFEEEEHRILGEEGFQKAVAEVAAVEKQLGIHDLSRFTPD